MLPCCESIVFEKQQKDVAPVLLCAEDWLVQERLNAPFTLDMEKEVSEFLFHHYRVHLNARPYMSMVFSCIPQV